MNLSIFVANYFDRLLWCDMTLRIIAENEHQVAEIVSKMCAPEYRGFGHGEGVTDDLSITKEQAIPFPYVLSVSGE